MNNVVLVHGAFVDVLAGRVSTRSSGETATVSALFEIQQLSLEDEVAVTNRTLKALDGPTNPRRPLLRRSGDH
jgi:hypothetical protein